MATNVQRRSDDKYTSNEYINNNPTWHLEDSPWKAEQILKIIKRNNLSPKTVAEIGCGAGEILHQLYTKMDKDVSFFGYEITQVALDLCMQRTEDRLKFELKNIFDDEHAFFDLIMAIDVVEHVEDYFSFLRNLKTKATYKLFHIPLELSAVKVLFPSYLMKSRRHAGHIQYFNKETALATLKDAGYEVVDFFYTKGAIEVKSSRNWENNLLNIPRRLLYLLNKDLPAKLLGGYSLMVLAK